MVALPTENRLEGNPYYPDPCKKYSEEEKDEADELYNEDCQTLADAYLASLAAPPVSVPSEVMDWAICMGFAYGCVCKTCNVVRWILSLGGQK